MVAGHNTVGHFAMVNLLMLQLFMPLNFMGMVYREIKQGLTDIERMMEVLDQSPEVADRPGAKRSGRQRRRDPFRRTCALPMIPSAKF